MYYPIKERGKQLEATVQSIAHGKDAQGWEDFERVVSESLT